MEASMGILHPASVPHPWEFHRTDKQRIHTFAPPRSRHDINSIAAARFRTISISRMCIRLRSDHEKASVPR
jgi:hypothetical protein